MESEHKATAVVWTPPGVSPPQELLGALGRGGLRVCHVSSEYLALAHLCRLERERASKRSSGALVVVNPERLRRAGELCEAAGRYAPRARCWMYAPGTNQRLRAIVQEDVEGWLKESVPSAGRGSAKKAPPRERDRSGKQGPQSSRTSGEDEPVLRLAGESEMEVRVQRADLSDGGAEASSGAARSKQVLTSEELEMLLDDREPTE